MSLRPPRVVSTSSGEENTAQVSSSLSPYRYSGASSPADRRLLRKSPVGSLAGSPHRAINAFEAAMRGMLGPGTAASGSSEADLSMDFVAGSLRFDDDYYYYDDDEDDSSDEDAGEYDDDIDSELLDDSYHHHPASNQHHHQHHHPHHLRRSGPTTANSPDDKPGISFGEDDYGVSQNNLDILISPPTLSGEELVNQQQQPPPQPTSRSGGGGGGGGDVDIESRQNKQLSRIGSRNANLNNNRRNSRRHHHSSETVPERILRKERERQFRLIDRAKVVARRLLRDVVDTSEACEDDIEKKLEGLNKKLEERAKAMKEASVSLEKYRAAQNEKPSQLFGDDPHHRHDGLMKKRFLVGDDDNSSNAGSFRHHHRRHLQQRFGGNDFFDDDDDDASSSMLGASVDLERRRILRHTENVFMCSSILDEAVMPLVMVEIDRIEEEARERRVRALDDLNTNEAERREQLRLDKERDAAEKKKSAEEEYLRSDDPYLTAIRRTALERREAEKQVAAAQSAGELDSAEQQLHLVRMRVDAQYREQYQRQEALKNERPDLAKLRAEMELLEKEQKEMEDEQRQQREAEEAEAQRLRDAESQANEEAEAERNALAVEARLHQFVQRSSAVAATSVYAAAAGGGSGVGVGGNGRSLSPQRGGSNSRAMTPLSTLQRTSSSSGGLVLGGSHNRLISMRRVQSVQSLGGTGNFGVSSTSSHHF